MEEDPNGRFICEACARRYDDGGDCPRCEGEPLLDLADEEVVLMLEGFDAAAQRKRYFLCFVAAAAIVVPLGFAAMIGVATIDVEFLGRLAVFAFIGLLIGLTTLFSYLFPARRKLPGDFAVGALSGSMGVPVGQLAEPAAVSTGSVACAACGTPVDPSSAYLDDDGRNLCPPCFEKGHAADLEIAAAKEAASDGVIGVIRTGALGIAGGELAQGVAEDVRQTRAWREPEGGGEGNKT